MLNLEPGLEILKKCQKIWPHYSEIIKNRKSCILDLVKYDISHHHIQQIIILGAGLDALSLEICSFSNGCKIFEIDNKNMTRKKDLIENVGSSLVDSISCIELNLFVHEKIIPKLKQNGWDENSPSLVVIEGLSYYLSEEKLWEIISQFQSKTLKNHVLLEYFLPQNKISPKFIPIAEYPFDLISGNGDLLEITRYSIDDIQNSLQKIECRIALLPQNEYN